MRNFKLRRWGAALGLLAMGLASGAWAQAVTVILQDGSVVKGDLLGVDGGTLSLQKPDGKSRDIPVDRIKRVFDADHKVVSLQDGAAATQGADQGGAGDSQVNGGNDQSDGGNGGGEPANDVVPSRRGRRGRNAAEEGSAASHRAKSLRGRKVAGEVLFWSGTGVTLVGLLAMLYGNNQESAATSSYYPNASYNSYYDYTISGYQGYYTYDQYTQYYYGQAWVDGGVVVGLVGIGCMLAGAIIMPSARAMENASLLNYDDHQLSLGVPQIGLTACGGPRASLLSATF